jgi:hypothetical protein
LSAVARGTLAMRAGPSPATGIPRKHLNGTHLAHAWERAHFALGQKQKKKHKSIILPHPAIALFVHQIGQTFRNQRGVA